MNTKRRGVFICKDCGYQINADVNGAKNIMKRAMGYMLTVGAAVTQPDGERRFVLHTPQPPPNGFRWKPLAIARGGGHREVKFLL